MRVFTMGPSCLGLALVLGVGCTNVQPLGTATGATTAEVTRQDIVGYEYFDAEVVVPPDAKASVYAPYRLPVSEVLASVGKRVGRGQVIMRLAMPNARESVAAAEANLKAAQSAYAAARAQNGLAEREAARSLAEARAAERAARNDPSQDLEAAVQGRKDAQSMHAEALAELNASLSAERQAVEAAAQYLGEVRKGAKIAEIRSPISGTVVSLETSVGTVVGSDPKAPVATIVDLDAILVRMIVPAEKRDRVKRGDRVVFTSTDRGAGTIDGTIKTVRVLPPKDGQKETVYIAMVSFDNSKGLISQDSIVKRAGIPVGRAEDSLVVPLAAVSQNSDGMMVVRVQKGSEWVESPIQTGLNDGALIEVKSGLQEGAIVRVPKG